MDLVEKFNKRCKKEEDVSAIESQIFKPEEKPKNGLKNRALEEMRGKTTVFNSWKEKQL